MTINPSRKVARVVTGVVVCGSALFLSAAALAQEAAPTVEESPPIIEEQPVQTKKFWYEAGIFGGAHFFDKDHGLGRFKQDSFDLSPNHGGAFGARLTMHANKWLAFEAEGVAVPTLTRDEVTAMWVFGFRGSVMVDFLQEGRFRPFVLAGYGVLTSIVEDPTYVGEDTDGMFHVGAGAKFNLTSRMGLRLDARIVTPPAFASGIAKIGDETHFGGPDFELFAGLQFYFGEGIKEKQVVVKRERQVVKLPPVDPDSDGIVGKADKCPDVAEDKDGFEDDDGCPEADNDADGIPDVSDKCPLKPETKNNIDDEDGCPEVDTDGDGFLGSRDKCPDEPETKNNFKDNDGCPDEVPAEVKRFTGVVEGINFKTKSAIILKNSFAILDKAVKVLSDYNEVRLEISGHTDNKGKADFNRDLSQKRADSVKEYFVKKGIASGRLTTIGYGMDRPIADNKKEAGRSKNRRTEFKLIPADGT